MEIGFQLLCGEDPGFLPACPPAVGAWMAASVRQIINHASISYAAVADQIDARDSSWLVGKYVFP